MVYFSCKYTRIKEGGGPHGEGRNDGLSQLWTEEDHCMNIQIFGASKCFDTKKAQRWFKERRIPVQDVDVRRFGMSRGELTSVARAVGVKEMVNPKHPQAALLDYLAREEDKLEKLFEDPALLRTPIVRNGRQATVGFCPQVWETWK